MSQPADVTPRTEIRDGMRITWHQGIVMDDGLRLDADVFAPVEDGRYPVILSYGVYAKGLAYQEGYPGASTTAPAAPAA
jgi:predicted acyl esterase